MPGARDFGQRLTRLELHYLRRDAAAFLADLATQFVERGNPATWSEFLSASEWDKSESDKAFYAEMVGILYGAWQQDPMRLHSQLSIEFFAFLFRGGGTDSEWEHWEKRIVRETATWSR